MKALSIRQPWAWLILNAGKDIENREWPTRFRGRFLIHASKGMTRDEYESAADCAIDIGRERPYPPGLKLPPFKDLERGGFVGSVELTMCADVSNSPWFFGPYGFALRDPQPMPFVPYRGQLGFFDVPDELVTTTRTTKDKS